LLVACSAFVDETVKLYADKAGFDIVLQAPLKIESIKEQILSNFN
jgi:hypothetical protein